MKLSEAMRIGSELLPQAREVFQVRNDNYEIEAACAIGAACFAVAPELTVDDFMDAEEIFPQLKDLVSYPAGEEAMLLRELIVYYNDDTPMPPAEIAEIVEKLGY
jgi:hypothetical protein